MKHWHRRRHSLGGKLVLLFLLMAVLFVLLVGGSIRKLFHDHFENDLRPHLIQYLEYIQQDIGLPPSRERATLLAKKLNVDIHIVEEDTIWSSSGKTLDYNALQIDHRFLQNNIEYGTSRVDSHEIFIAHYGSTSLYFDIPNLHIERKGRSLIPLMVLLLILLMLYHFTRRIIGPVAILKAGIKRFGQGELDHRIELSRRDELGELADNINDMADDIQQMLDAKRQLLLAISHELRTPLTRAKVSLELMDEDKQKHEFSKDLNEMETLIEELLETERLSTRHHKLNKQAYDLNTLVHSIIDSHFPDAGIFLQLPRQSIELNLDGARIKLLLKNLLDNALRHTPDGAPPPELNVDLNHNTIRITVRDHGEGIEEEHTPHLTEPFYRADPSRRRETGGYGLGLYLCRVIAEAHAGALHIDSTVGKGTAITLTLPTDTHKA